MRATEVGKAEEPVIDMVEEVEVVLDVCSEEEDKVVEEDPEKEVLTVLVEERRLDELADVDEVLEVNIKEVVLEIAVVVEAVLEVVVKEDWELVLKLVVDGTPELDETDET